MSYERDNMLAQGYTPVTGAPVCINCRHRQVLFVAGVKRFICAEGGFNVTNFGSCNRHQMPAGNKLVDFTKPGPATLEITS